ncbi:MAG: hypothetical protein J1F69_06215 [Clostridiales bacterium]|nr:hypothetical protein [Clostridiales bacterium]
MSKKEKQPIEIENSDIGILQFCLKVLYGHENDELAWRLIERFGSVSGIFSAVHEELMSIDGMTDRVATFFTVMRPIQRQAQLRAVKGLTLESERNLAEYAAVYFMNEFIPTDVCVCLDKKYRVYHAEPLGKDERVRELVALACRRNAQKIVMLRFEPHLYRKSVLPAKETQKTLIKIANIMSTLGIEFVDYIEYYQNCFFSLRRAVKGDIGVYHVFDAEDKPVAVWDNVAHDLETYYGISVAHAIEFGIKQSESTGQ